MEFRTKVPLPEERFKITYDSEIFLLGSCFVEHIGKKLKHFQFKTRVNPFGIIYHPEAMYNFIQKVHDQAVYSEEDLIFHNEQWKTMDAHSALSDKDKLRLIHRLNQAVEDSYQFLRKASHVLLTPGTAWGFVSKDSGKVVANCHKLPQVRFEKQLREVDEVFFESVRMLRSLNPSVKIIFTVSPVRHQKDGFIGNQLSKAKLLIGAHRTLAEFQEISYFPAYEIVLDELRDYRFYSRDMLHPNEVAVDYVWKQFETTWLDPITAGTMKRVEAVQRALGHKAFDEESDAHKRFVQELDKKILELQEEYPHMKFHEGF